MSSPMKKSIQVHLRPEQLEALRALARQRQLTVAELVRQGIDRFLADVPTEADPLWNIVGLVDTGPKDLAEKHDDYIVAMVHEESE